MSFVWNQYVKKYILVQAGVLPLLPALPEKRKAKHPFCCHKEKIVVLLRVSGQFPNCSIKEQENEYIL